MDEGQARQVITVSALNAEARAVLEGHFPPVWVEGELSNFSAPASGHWYFTLKDERAQVRCAMFRGRNVYCQANPRNGMHVQVLAQVSLFEGRGDFQLLVEQLLEAGAGSLQARFEQLKERLAAEGLFRPEIKRPLPRWPRRLGVITSPSGAAIRDILATLRKRWPSLSVTIYPVAVQGEEAAPQIVAALAQAGRRRREDVLILARGGGSLEDLWAFNDGGVARAIRACPIAVVTGIGHETDFTIADLAADLRAPTPTGAAQAVSPDRLEWEPRVRILEDRLRRAMQRGLREATLHLEHLRARLRHPAERIGAVRERLQSLRLRLERQMSWRLRDDRLQLAHLRNRLQARDPRLTLVRQGEALGQLRTALSRAMADALARQKNHLAQLTRQLQLLSPLQILGRGYAIVLGPDGTPIQDAQQVAVGSEVLVHLKRGELDCRVTGRRLADEP